MNQREILLEEQRSRIMRRANRKIWITFIKQGYPSHENNLNNKTNYGHDESFMTTSHLRNFHFRVWIDVAANDGIVTPAQFKRYIEDLYSSNVLELDHKSCEMIADDLFQQIAIRFPERTIHIEVSLDGEDGVTVYYETHNPSTLLKI